MSDPHWVEDGISRVSPGSHPAGSSLSHPSPTPHLLHPPTGPHRSEAGYRDVACTIIETGPESEVVLRRKLWKEGSLSGPEKLKECVPTSPTRTRLLRGSTPRGWDSGAVVSVGELTLSLPGTTHSPSPNVRTKGTRRGGGGGETRQQVLGPADKFLKRWAHNH